jgi:hypothetical protein
MRGAPAAEHIIKGLENFGGVGLFEGKKFHGTAETVYANQNVAAAISVWFTESHDVKGVRRKGAPSDGSSFDAKFFKGWSDFLACETGVAVAVDFILDVCLAAAWARSQGFDNPPPCAKKARVRVVMRFLKQVFQGKTACLMARKIAMRQGTLPYTSLRAVERVGPIDFEEKTLKGKMNA